MGKKGKKWSRNVKMLVLSTFNAGSCVYRVYLTLGNKRRRPQASLQLGHTPGFLLYVLFSYFAVSIYIGKISSDVLSKQPPASSCFHIITRAAIK